MPSPPRTMTGEVSVYREIFVPVDNSAPSDWAVDRAIELCHHSGGRITGNHVYAARLHDVRFRQLETGLPARFQTPEELKKQRIEKDFARSDELRDELARRGVTVIDTPAGQRIKR
ncbi:MAG TPA: universal stress protein [Gemmatimonadales bacterium]|nr:universal stress protein [Gemmatimonadales bacterium]